jgi:signal transduction histidine kinase
MVTLVDGVFGVGILVGLVLVLLGYYSHRQFDELGVTAFAVFAGVLGAGAVCGAVVGIAGMSLDGEFPLWVQILILFWSISALPWAVFAVQYTGRYIRIGRRTVGVLLVPYVGLVTPLVLVESGVIGAAVGNVISSLVLVYCLGLALVGVYLLVRTTYAYGQFSAWQGATLSLAPLVTFLILNSLSIFATSSELVAAALFVGGFAVAPVALGLALRRGIFAASPAVGTLGERTVVRETEDLVLVVDERGRPLRLNETALATLGVSRTEAFDTDLAGLLGHDTETLRARETVSLETSTGTRQYDPQVSMLTGLGRELGALLSLRDVTERELREQRLSVLNRVLRHNLRNKIDVVKTHTEVLDAELDGYTEHTERLAATAEEIAQLGRNARQIDQFVAEETEETTVDVVAAVSATLEAVDAAEADVEVAVDAPESLQVVTNRRALTAALESALDNAVSYADSAVTVTVSREGDDCSVSVADDGPGIPEGELDWLDSGVETPLQHGTGLGLWQLKWAVTTLGGELSFETTDGTTVEITVPDLGQRE